MDSLVTESWGCIGNGNGNNDLNEKEDMEIDSAVPLMTLLEDSQVEDEVNVERLRIVIQSLEAEISPVVNDSAGHVPLLGEQPSLNGLLLDYCQFTGAEEAASDQGFSWIDDAEMVSSSTADDVNCIWFLEPCGAGGDDQTGGIITEFDGIIDDDNYQFCYGVLPEVDGYSSLWQES